MNGIAFKSKSFFAEINEDKIEVKYIKPPKMKLVENSPILAPEDIDFANEHFLEQFFNGNFEGYKKIIKEKYQYPFITSKILKKITRYFSMKNIIKTTDFYIVAFHGDFLLERLAENSTLYVEKDGLIYETTIIGKYFLLEEDDIDNEEVEIIIAELIESEFDSTIDEIVNCKNWKTIVERM